MDFGCLQHLLASSRHSLSGSIFISPRYCQHPPFFPTRQPQSWLVWILCYSHQFCQWGSERRQLEFHSFPEHLSDFDHVWRPHFGGQHAVPGTPSPAHLDLFGSITREVRAPTNPDISPAPSPTMLYLPLPKQGDLVSSRYTADHRFLRVDTF